MNKLKLPKIMFEFTCLWCGSVVHLLFPCLNVVLRDANHILWNIYVRDLKKLTISYPCVMLNVDVARNNTNDQYQVSK